MTIAEREMVTWREFNATTADFYEVIVQDQTRLTVGLPEHIEYPESGAISVYETVSSDRPRLDLPLINGMLPFHVEVRPLEIPSDASMRKLALVWPIVELPRFAAAVRVELVLNNTERQLTPFPQPGSSNVLPVNQEELFDQADFTRWPLRK